jgi:ADP-ribose pyrophosphatase
VRPDNYERAIVAGACQEMPVTDARRARLNAYRELAASRPELFETAPGGVRILLEPDEIARVEDDVARSLAERGLPVEGAEVGIVLRDPWFLALRDAVEFPDGARRTHTRTVNHVGNGVATLPVLDGKIVLARHFRHAVRRWMLEIPRGAIESGQSMEDTARAELEEEIGARVRALTRLGFLFGTSNLSANGAHLYLAELDAVGEPQLGEGIAAVETVTVAEFEDLLMRGEILDSFTVAAYTHARLRRLI